MSCFFSSSDVGKPASRRCWSYIIFSTMLRVSPSRSDNYEDPEMNVSFLHVFVENELLNFLVELFLYWFLDQTWRHGSTIPFYWPEKRIFVEEENSPSVLTNFFNDEMNCFSFVQRPKWIFDFQISERFTINNWRVAAKTDEQMLKYSLKIENFRVDWKSKYFCFDFRYFSFEFNDNILGFDSNIEFDWNFQLEKQTSRESESRSTSRRKKPTSISSSVWVQL